MTDAPRLQQALTGTDCGATMKSGTVAAAHNRQGGALTLDSG
ncbi:hypothetical protein [Gimesia chilikensis]|nr:hypothetical protein [Gimesia chilikensis]